MQAACDAVDAVAVERLLHLFEVVGRELLRIVELVVVHQVAEPLDSRSHFRRGGRSGELGLVPSGIEPCRHRSECPDAQARLHLSLLLSRSFAARIISCGAFGRRSCVSRPFNSPSTSLSCVQTKPATSPSVPVSRAYSAASSSPLLTCL